LPKEGKTYRDMADDRTTWKIIPENINFKPFTYTPTKGVTDIWYITHHSIYSESYNHKAQSDHVLMGIRDFLRINKLEDAFRVNILLVDSPTIYFRGTISPTSLYYGLVDGHCGPVSSHCVDRVILSPMITTSSPRGFEEWTKYFSSKNDRGLIDTLGANINWFMFTGENGQVIDELSNNGRNAPHSFAEGKHRGGKPGKGYYIDASVVIKKIIDIGKLDISSLVFFDETKDILGRDRVEVSHSYGYVIRQQYAHVSRHQRALKNFKDMASDIPWLTKEVMEKFKGCTFSPADQAEDGSIPCVARNKN